jgi:hypothetical protein
MMFPVPVAFEVPLVGAGIYALCYLKLIVDAEFWIRGKAYMELCIQKRGQRIWDEPRGCAKKPVYNNTVKESRPITLEN